MNQYALKNPLALAALGDAVITMFVREDLIANQDLPIAKIHSETAKIVNAKSQSIFFETIEDWLNDVEQDIARRAINKKTNSIPKNATLAEYKKATAFEAVVGYLYITKNFYRLNQMMQHIAKSGEE